MLLVRAHLARAVLLAALTLAAALLLTTLLMLATLLAALMLLAGLLALTLLTGLLTLLLVELDRLARFGFVPITAHVALFAILTHVTVLQSSVSLLGTEGCNGRTITALRRFYIPPRR